jgi:hypothetical protein
MKVVIAMVGDIRNIVQMKMNLHDYQDYQVALLVVEVGGKM